MTLILSGTDGLSDVDGSAATPAIRGTDANTGIFFPAADTVGVSTGGSERVRVDSSGNVGIGLTSYNLPLSVKADANGQNVQLNGRTGDDFGQIFFRNFGGANNLARIASDNNAGLIFGTGSQTAPTVPTERMRIDSSGNVLVKSAAGLGYGTGSGGTVTQATSKATAVTLNKPTGQITMNNAALAAGATAIFSVTNSVVAATDTVILSITAASVSAASNYRFCPTVMSAGSFQITIENRSAGSLSEAVVINFTVIKGATA